MAVLFFSYSHEDEEYRDRLEMALANLKHQGEIENWHDRLIPAGDELAPNIDANLDRADIILLLVSPAFLASSYCRNIEMPRALERNKLGEARVVPIILRPCDWLATPLKALRATPKDGLPISKWPNIDDAYQWITDDIRRVIREIDKRPALIAPLSLASQTSTSQASSSQSVIRSSNLRISKVFSQADRDRFLRDAFEFAARFFEGSLAELQARQQNIETSFLRVDANRFTGVIYQDGKARSRFKISIGGTFGGVTYSSSDSITDNSINENIVVNADQVAMYLDATMSIFGHDRQKLSFEGAAEYLWEKVMAPLQGRVY